MPFVPLLLVVKTGVLRSRGDLNFGFLPWEALFVRTVEVPSGGSRLKASDEDREPAQSSFDDRHVVECVVVEFYSVEVSYYVSPCYNFNFLIVSPHTRPWAL